MDLAAAAQPWLTADRVLLDLTLALLVVYLFVQRQRQTLEELREIQRRTEADLRSLIELRKGIPSRLSEGLFDEIRSATFAILDGNGLPVCCGFFVSACGVALTADRGADKWLRKKKGKRSTVRAATYDNKEFDLEVVEREVGGLNIAVLRLPSAAAAAAQACLPLPRKTFTEKELSGAPVNLVHGSIAWSAGATMSSFAQDCGSIIASNAAAIHYNVRSYSMGRLGAALLLDWGGQVIALHTDYYDLPDEESERRSTAADAVRLDNPAVRAAVERHVRKKSA